MTASTAYSRAWKLPGPGGERRLMMRTLTSKMEPKKLGVGVIAGCCLALLTYVSVAKLFAIYSPVLASTANTSALMQQQQHTSPPSSRPSVPETEAIPFPPPQEETLAATGGGNDDLPEEAAAAAGDGGSSEEEEPRAGGRLFPADDSVVLVNKKKRKEVAAVLGEEPGMKPRMLIVSRRAGATTAQGRLLLLKNLDEVSAAASELGFNVTALTTVLAEGAADVQVMVNSADVLLAVHGAGLTADQIAFLPTKAVVVQIVPPKTPWGTDGDLLPDMQQLRYLEYKVGEEEMSTTLQGQGWQDVRVNLDKFRPLLLQALDRLQE